MNVDIYRATCHSDGCENAGYEIEQAAEGDPPYIVCGPCAQIITDITPV